MQVPTADRIAAGLLSVLYPSRCPHCERPTDTFRHSPFCTACWAQIQPYRGPACGICAEPFNSPDARTCGRCLSGPQPMSQALSFGLYDGPLKAAIHELKYFSARRLAQPLGAMLAGLGLPAADIAVPVPLSPRGLRQRGFNQAHLISRAACATLGVRVIPGLLVKKKETLPQARLTSNERVRNVRGAFGLKNKLGGERVLLIDDVVTTGATVRECARTLLKAGAAEVLVACVARASAL